MMQTSRKQGFTLVELTLAMAFVTFLLLSVVLVAIQAGKMYNRGIVLGSVNQAGRDIGDTVRRDFLQTDQRRISVGDSQDTAVRILRQGGSERSGRFCLGQYSYLWNVPAVLDRDTSEGGELINDGPIVRDTDGHPITFVRVADENGDLCRETDGSYPTQLTDMTKVTHLLKQPSADKDVVLAIHRMIVQPIGRVDNASDGLYRFRFVVGTSRTAEITGQACKPPVDDQSNLEFCAINEFDMIVRTNG